MHTYIISKILQFKIIQIFMIIMHLICFLHFNSKNDKLIDEVLTKLMIYIFKCLKNVSLGRIEKEQKFI